MPPLPESQLSRQLFGFGLASTIPSVATAKVGNDGQNGLPIWPPIEPITLGQAGNSQH